MAKEKTGAAEKTPDLLKRKPGRPKTGQAMTGAQRIAKLRAERKTAGVCVACGSVAPSGWVLVPIVPTEAMLEASTHVKWSEDKWSAFLSAAPSFG